MLGGLNINSTIADHLKSSLYFNQDYLNPAKPQACNANAFFKEITQMVNLQNIYKLVSIAYYNDYMRYCPVLLEIPTTPDNINDKLIQAHGGCKYLLQVYDKKKDNKKIYEKPLKAPIRTWANCFKYLAFLVEEDDDDSRYLHVVEYKTQNTVKVKNFGQDPLGILILIIQLNLIVKYVAYHNDKLYTATNKIIEVMSLPSTEFLIPENIIDAQSYRAPIRKLEPGLNIWGLLLENQSLIDNYVIACMETNDNQIDFNQLEITDIEESSFSYTWKQYREIKPRADPEKGQFWKSDPIVKAVFVFYEDFASEDNERGGDFNYSLVLRKSGNVDFYWNFFFMESTTNEQVADIQMTCDSFYFKMQNGEFKGFDHNNKSTASFSEAKELACEFKWEEVDLRNVQNMVQLYTGFHIFSISSGNEEINYVAISHGKFISIYNLALNIWEEHIQFKSDVIYIFSHEKSFDATQEEIEELEEGSEILPKIMPVASCITSDGMIFVDFMRDSNGNIPGYLSPDQKTQKIDGQAVKFAHDKANLFVIHKNQENIHLSHMYRSTFEKRDSLIYDSEMINIVQVQTESKAGGVYYVIQTDHKIALYQLKDKSNEENAKNEPVKVREYPQFDKIEGEIHSATSYDINRHIFLFDSENIYVIKNNPYELKVYKDIYCIGVLSFNKSYNYAICQQNFFTKNGGLKLFDMERIINKQNAGMIMVKSLDIGAYGQISLSHSLERMAFLRSFTDLAIIPILHRNMNKFFGAAETNDYITYKVIKDKMFALTKDGVLSCWDITTAQHKSRKQLNDFNYEDYQLASQYKKDAVLIKSKEKLEDINDREYFKPYLFENTIEENQQLVVEQGEHCYRRFKYIEIENESNVQVHFEFIHPSYDYQYIFFNKDKTKMIEVLFNFRTFLYKRINTTPGQVKWELIRPITDYPAELANDNGHYLGMFSPCFTKYIVTNKQTKEFVIKDAIVDQVIAHLPKEYLTVPDDFEIARNVMNRCHWVGSNTLLVCSEEGIEKLIDLEDTNFREIGFNARPLYKNINMQPITEDYSGNEYEDYQYYFMRENLGFSSSDILVRLKRCYQQYKTSYFLYGRRSMSQLYEDLITVDPYEFTFNVNSFTFLHWSLIEQIQSGEMKIDDLEQEVFTNLLYNILPGGNTVLHKLAESNEDQLLAVFRRSHPDILVEGSEPSIHIPFIPNLEQKTPIHLCVKKLQYKSIDSMLKYLKFYPTDHHSRAIKTTYGEMVAKQLPEFLPYLESRLQQTEQTQTMQKGLLKEDTNGMLPCELWFKQKDVEKELMQEGKLISNRIKVEFIDLPGVYHYLDEEFGQMFEELAKTQKIEFFNVKVIQKIVDFNYPLVKEFIIKKLFIPFCVFQFLYFTFMHLIQSSDSELANKLYYPWLGLVLLFATYFVVNEVRQLVGEGITYLLNFWNYIDLIPPFGIYFIAMMMILKNYDYYISLDIEKSIQAIITFFMWFKFLYFLRIFKNTGYLIRMIIEVIKDMMVFFVVLFITIAAFGDAFLRISLANEPTTDEDGAYTEIFTTNFVDSVVFTYRMVLGDFDTSAFGSVATGVCMVLWFLCTVFNMIVMLNLLIAIISDSYARVAAISAQATYQERCRMIAENSYLIPDAKKLSYATKDKFLLVVTNLEEESGEDVDPVIQQVNIFKEDVKTQFKETKKQILDINTKIERIQENLDFHGDHFRSLRKLLYMNMPKTSIKVKVHENPLVKYTYETLKLEEKNYSEAWYCDGKELCGCRDNKDYYNNNPDEKRWHCAECSFDYCEECYKFYGNTHQHKLEHITYEEARQRHPGKYEYWNCDGRKNKSICPQGEPYDDLDVIWHDSVECYDLCEFCARKYKVEE